MLDLQGVSVRYGDKDTRPVLEQIDLTLSRGYSVALTGPTGSGKSSLLHLMAGFLAPDSGVVTVFGEAPGARPFGWLGQKGFWIQGTWADNLRLTTPDASDEAIKQALHQVGLDDLVASREQGINSPLSESGQGLSGGQARRLSLARIFLADYDLILLDEPTAGLDANSEQQIINALKALHAQGKTLVFSTHHSALLSLADRVLVVENREVRDA
jgi:ATP-binding cassette subfamily C protein CydD